MTQNQNLLEEISRAVVDLDDERVNHLTCEALKAAIAPHLIVEAGLRRGITIVGDSFSRGEVFLPELMLAAQAMQGAIEILKPEMAKTQTQTPNLGRVIIGTVAGDLHDLGKGLVISLLEMAGFEVIDLGIDVPSQKFVESVAQYRPDVIGMSALMSTTLRNQQKVMEALVEEGLRDRVKVIVGGAAVTSEWAENIGADGYSDNATDAVGVVKTLLGQS
jgi:corrinoid protein of di/trimethylamine methyltransferase